jgi:putative DNA methylase
MNDDRRLIEDYLPIQAISAEASREKSVRKGHISTLHLWWARRPLVACRAAVYGALVPASRFRPANGPEEKRDSLARANAAKFVERLCKYPGAPQVIAEAQRHILEAHAERLTKETGKPVTVEDIVEGRAPRPKVLDMFAGGGAIPLEALRLGCEAYALDLNPVAHIIELCTLVYPQKYGKPDPNARGMTGPRNEKGQTTWGGLAEEVRYWGNWVLEKVKAEIGDLYPLIPDPEYKGRRPESQATLWKSSKKDDVPPGYLVPVRLPLDPNGPLQEPLVRGDRPPRQADVALQEEGPVRRPQGHRTQGREEGPLRGGRGDDPGRPGIRSLDRVQGRERDVPVLWDGGRQRLREGRRLREADGAADDGDRLHSSGDPRQALPVGRRFAGVHPGR